MIKMINVKKKYPQFELNCTLEIQPGQITGLIGQNGAGKSTTFKLILDLIHKDSGEVMLFGKNTDQLSSKEREGLGVVLSDSGFSEYLNIKDVMGILERMYSQFEKTKFLEYCVQFKLPMNKPIKDFSTGMKAKLKVISAMTHHAKLLILDEPTAGLDVIARDELLDVLRVYMEENEDASILISSHISGDLETLCDDLYMIDQGHIILHEETDVLLSEYGVLKVLEEEYETLDKQHILSIKKENFGYACLTNQKSYYMENYPEVKIEKGTIDEVILLMIRGIRAC